MRSLHLLKEALKTALSEIEVFEKNMPLKPDPEEHYISNPSPTPYRLTHYQIRHPEELSSELKKQWDEAYNRYQRYCESGYSGHPVYIFSIADWYLKLDEALEKLKG